MLKLCLFDLDQTLVRTNHLEELRIAGIGKQDDPDYVNELTQQFQRPGGFFRRFRTIYSEHALQQLKASIPGLRIGVFTRSPRLYAHTILSIAYPNIRWDVVVAYEDVQHTKPYPDGILSAMQQLNVADLNECVMVGDELNDVLSAYRAGVSIVLDQSSWSQQRENKHWRALDSMPDVIISSSDQLLAALQSPSDFLPALEARIENPHAKGHRFCRRNHFFPDDFPKPTGPHPIYSAGRYFSRYQELHNRRQWHSLTQQIEALKDSTQFPNEWVSTICCAIQNYSTLTGGQQGFAFSGLTITTVPPRPGRIPRLYHFLNQLAQAHQSCPFTEGFDLTFNSDVFGYREGVQSNSGEHLKKVQRFQNVGNHLYIKQTHLVNQGRYYLVLDDVVTSGASLLYCKKYLEDAGAGHVACLALAHNIGALYPDDNH